MCDHTHVFRAGGDDLIEELPILCDLTELDNSVYWQEMPSDLTGISIGECQCVS